MRITLLILTICFTWNLSFSQESSIGNYLIKGTVIAVLGIKPIPNSESVIQLTGEKTEITETNEEGKFSFEHLKNGIYKLKVVSRYGSIDTVLVVDNKSILDFNATFFSDCEVNSKIAIQDLKKGKPKLLIFGGIAPSVYSNQHIFETKYGIEYYSFGDSNAPQYECVLEYNQVIFNYLTDKFGKKWRKEVRKDVVGIKKKKAWR